MKSILSLLADLFWTIDEPPDRIGLFGFAILAVFLLFCVVVWFVHPAPH